jgi:hypothetical protein
MLVALSCYTPLLLSSMFLLIFVLLRRIRRNLSGSRKRSSTFTCCLMSRRSGVWTSGCLIRRRICLRELDFLWRSVAFAYAFVSALSLYSNEWSIVNGMHH